MRDCRSDPRRPFLRLSSGRPARCPLPPSASWAGRMWYCDMRLWRTNLSMQGKWLSFQGFQRWRANCGAARLHGGRPSTIPYDGLSFRVGSTASVCQFTVWNLHKSFVFPLRDGLIRFFKTLITYLIRHD